MGDTVAVNAEGVIRSLNDAYADLVHPDGRKFMVPLSWLKRLEG